MRNHPDSIDLRPTRHYYNPSNNDYEHLYPEDRAGNRHLSPYIGPSERRGDSPMTDLGTVLSHSEYESQSLSICAMFASRLMYTRCYLIFYVCVTVLTFILIIYDIGQRDHFLREEVEPVWFIILDSVCVVFLLIEVLIRYFASQVTFWKSPFNIFDTMVVILCVLALVLYSHVPDSDVISAASLLLRYITQLMRLIIFLRWLSRNHNALVAADTTKVDFNYRRQWSNRDYSGGSASVVGYHGEYWDNYSLMSWGTAGSENGGSNRDRNSRDPRWISRNRSRDPRWERKRQAYEVAESVATSADTAII